MNTTSYGYSKEVDYDFDTAVQKTTEELKKEGFGILTTIDVKAKMKEKIGEDMDDYIILGACNPPSAYKILRMEIEIGLLLPCNVIVYKKNDKVHVSAIRPTQAMSMVDQPELKPLAEEIEQKLKTVIGKI